MTALPANSRYDWVDVAKGICIILVVMMHSTLGVEKAVGASTWLGDFVAWAQPFRMPDFFLISGLFLAARIDRPWRAYIDTKVIHFAYFYVLWLTIQLAMKAPAIVADGGLQALAYTWARSFIEPFGTLWFIYLLAVFFVTAKALRSVPKWIVLAAAAAMHVWAPETGSFLVNEFTDRFVFFYSGYAAAAMIFAMADQVRATTVPSLLGMLAIWVVFNTAGVASGVAMTHGPDLVFSYTGIAAVIALSVMLATHTTAFRDALAYCGRNSISIYLAFTIFMGPTRIVLLKVTGGAMPEAVALASMSAGIIGSLIMSHLVAGTRLDFLFKRPSLFRLQSEPARDGRKAPMAQATA